MEAKEKAVIYPLGKDRKVTIDPRRQFGAPCVHFRTPTHALYSLFTAGEPLASVAEYFELSEEEVLDAIQYEAMSRCTHGRKAIKKASEKEPY